jgi:hypothetical protein
LQLANDSDFQSARKGLAPSGKITPRKLVFVVEICIFELFEKLSGCVLHMQGTHSGLLQWLLPDFPTENPLLNGMFCYICGGLVLVQRH